MEKSLRLRTPPTADPFTYVIHVDDSYKTATVVFNTLTHDTIRYSEHSYRDGDPHPLSFWLRFAPCMYSVTTIHLDAPDYGRFELMETPMIGLLAIRAHEPPSDYFNMPNLVDVTITGWRAHELLSRQIRIIRKSTMIALIYRHRPCDPDLPVIYNKDKISIDTYYI